MTTWTISTEDGRTVTSSRVLELRDTVCSWYPAMPGREIATALKQMLDAVRDGHVFIAGMWATELNLNLAWAPGSHDATEPVNHGTVTEQRRMLSYLVPVDPASLNDCEACQ